MSMPLLEPKMSVISKASCLRSIHFISSTCMTKVVIYITQKMAEIRKAIARAVMHDNIVLIKINYVCGVLYS